MANISAYLAAIMAAVYGQDVRSSIHDAIEIINDVSEVVLTTGTAVTGPTSSSTGFYDNSLYLNTNTMELWKCVGTNSWTSQGFLKGSDGRGITSIAKTSTSGLVDTYTITYDSGSPSTFTVTNGADGADGANGSVWYKGTAITGTGSGMTGFPGNEHDFYLNSTDGYVYTCTASGTAVTATWDYVMTLTGGGGSSVTVVDNLNSTSGTDALSANQGHVLNTTKIDDPTTKTNGQVLTYNGAAWVAQTPATGVTTLAALTDTDINSPATNEFLRYNSSGKWENQAVTIPTVNDGKLAITLNGSTTYNFYANQASNTSLSIDTDEWFSTSATVSSGSVTFSGVNDTANNGYELFVQITSSSLNKNPTAQIDTLSGEGTSSMSITFTTDADNGATCKLRIIR